MEHKVIYRDNQELPARDLQNAEDWAQEALDNVVLDTIHPASAYSGFALSKAAATVIQTMPGRLYSSGKVYAREETVSMDVFNELPVTNKRYFAVVAWGQTVQEDIQPRDFLIDADTGQAEPQSVSMEETRYCNVNTVRGVESADPQVPSVDATNTLIGYVLCDPTGIVSYQQAAGSQVDNLAMVAASVRGMQTMLAIMQTQISTLRTDLANLAKQLLLYTPLSDFQKLVDLVNWIYAKVNKPATFIFYGTDNFLDTTQSAVGTTLDGQPYSARVEEGLRFPGGGTGWIGKLALLNPSESVIQSWDGFMLPKPSGSRVRYDCSFPQITWKAVRILSFGYWSFNCRHLRPSRWRHRCGPHYGPCPPSQVWWYQAQLDPTIRILSFAGIPGITVAETWEVVEWKRIVEHVEWSVYWPRHGWDRWKYYWRDWVDLHYWAKVYTDYSHSGNHMAQTFYNAQDGWLSGITLFSHKAAFYQPLTLVVTGCTDDGTPDQQNHTLRRVVLSAGDIQTCYDKPIYAGDITVYGTYTYTQAIDTVFQVPTGDTHWEYKPGIGQVEVPEFRDVTRTEYVTRVGQTQTSIPTYIWPLRVNFPPVFLRAGAHFAIHVHAIHDHEFSFCDDNDFPFQVHQGHFWHHNGTIFTRWLEGPRSLRFQAHFATWGRWGDQPSPGGQLKYEINLQPLQLAGGIGSVDVLAEAVIPAATDLNYAVQVGGIWKKFDQDFTSLTGTDALLPFRVEMTGTTDLMPGVSLDNSEVTLTKAALNAFRHISTVITFGSPTNSIKVVCRLKNFVAAHHTLNVAIHHSGTTHLDGTEVYEPAADDGTIVVTTTFSVSSVTTCQVELTGTTDGVGENFIVMQRIIYCT